MWGGEFSFEAYRVWRMAEYASNALPYPDGWFAQPVWLREDLETLMTLNRAHEMRADKKGGVVPRIE